MAGANKIHIWRDMTHAETEFRIEPRKDPRISINKLAEYLSASPARRQTIVRDQKYPSPIRAPYYNEAEAAILSFFENGRNYTVLDRAMMDLGQRTPDTILKTRMASSSLDALVAFADTGLDLLEGFTPVVLPRAQAKLVYQDVAVSVRPELLLKRQHDEKTTVGVLKLYFSKGEPLSEDGGKFVTAACCEHLLQHLKTEGQPDLKAVYVLDVLAKKFFLAPKATKKRLKDISAACSEISAVWKTL